MAKLENLIGRRFGRLQVLQHAGYVKNGKQRQSAWLCRCDCETEVVVSNNNLKRYTNSCGCLQKQRAFEANIKDISGQRFGMLEVIGYTRTTNKSSVWKCRCDCDKEVEISANALRAGQKSCGCKQGWWRSARPGLWKDKAAHARWQRQNPIKKLRNRVSSSIRSMLKHNGSYKRKKSIRTYLPYTIEELKIHLESLWEPWMNWNNYGGKPNDPRRTWHIDHIKPHSLFVYKSMNDKSFSECWALSNLRPLEKKANMSKGDR